MSYKSLGVEKISTVRSYTHKMATFSGIEILISFDLDGSIFTNAIGYENDMRLLGYRCKNNLIFATYKERLNLLSELKKL